MMRALLLLAWAGVCSATNVYAVGNIVISDAILDPTVTHCGAMFGARARVYTPVEKNERGEAYCKFDLQTVVPKTSTGKFLVFNATFATLDANGNVLNESPPSDQRYLRVTVANGIARYDFMTATVCNERGTCFPF